MSAFSIINNQIKKLLKQNRDNERANIKAARKAKKETDEMFKAAEIAMYAKSATVIFGCRDVLKGMG